jgi:hypothetical protein
MNNLLRNYNYRARTAALGAARPGFVGVVELERATGEQICAFDAAGVRAVRFNLHRGGSLDLGLARRVHEVAFAPADLEQVAAIAPEALADNARAWYRPRA